MRDAMLVRVFKKDGSEIRPALTFKGLKDQYAIQDASIEFWWKAARGVPLRKKVKMEPFTGPIWVYADGRGGVMELNGEVYYLLFEKTPRDDEMECFGNSGIE